ncbi:MAG: hypothetical protein GF350_11650 [Chitinivibrionales bacterium]|nr:hypothetical protein [Chitinivibrionales bacterium]
MAERKQNNLTFWGVAALIVLIIILISVFFSGQRVKEEPETGVPDTSVIETDTGAAVDTGARADTATAVDSVQ